MNTGLDIERVLDIWFEDGPRTVAERVVDEALRSVERTEQQRGWRAILRAPARPMPRWTAYAALAVALAIGLAVVASVLGGRGFFVAPTTLSSPSPSPSTGAASPSAGSILRTSKPPRPAGATLLLMGNPMGDGETYTTLSFEPAFTIRGSAGWLIPLPAPGGGRLEGPAHAYFFAHQPGGNPAIVPSLAVIRPSQVISQGGASTEPVPNDLIGWLQARTDLDLGKPFPVTIGGLDGTAIEGTVRRGAAANSVGAINILCSTDNASCGWTNGEEIGAVVGERFRFVVLDVRGQTVVLAAGDDTKAWSQHLPELERLMNTITFPSPTG
jgi:hypothetical protein